jgi:hypothetical protein
MEEENLKRRAVLEKISTNMKVYMENIDINIDDQIN